ncbi:hypothetical protein D3C79_585970 [compost metagenome]
MAHLQQLQHAVHAGDGGAQLVTHGGEEPAAHPGRLLRYPPRLAQLQLLAFQVRDVLHHPVQDDALEPLLPHEVTPDLQVTRLPLALDLHLEIQRFHGPGMLLDGVNEVLMGLPRQPENRGSGACRLHRFIFIAHYLSETLGGVEEVPIARPQPMVLVNQARHAVGDLGESGLGLLGREPRLFQLGHIGQHGQDPESLAAGADEQALGVDHLMFDTVGELDLAAAMELLATLPDPGILLDHPGPDGLRQPVLEQSLIRAVQVLAPQEHLPIRQVGHRNFIALIGQHHLIGQGIEHHLDKHQLFFEPPLRLPPLADLAAQGPVPAHEQQQKEHEDAPAQGGPEQHLVGIQPRLYGQGEPLLLQGGQLRRRNGEQHLGQDLLQHGILQMGCHGDGNPQFVAGEDHLITVAESLLQRLFQGGHAHQHVVDLLPIQLGQQLGIARDRHGLGPHLGQQRFFHRAPHHAHPVSLQRPGVGQLGHASPRHYHPVERGIVRRETGKLLSFGGRCHGRDDIQLASLKQIQGLGPASGLYQGELQTRALVHHRQQIGNEPLEPAPIVNLAHAGPVRGDPVPDHRMRLQPRLLLRVEDNLPVPFHQGIVDDAASFQDAATLQRGDALKGPVQQPLQYLAPRGDRHGERGIPHPVHRGQRHARHGLQAAQHGQLGQIGVRLPLLEHEDRFIPAVHRHQVRDAESQQLIASADTEDADPTHPIGLLQGETVPSSGQQDGARQRHQRGGKQHLQLACRARCHADHHVDLAIQQCLLDPCIVGIGLVAQLEPQPACYLRGKFIQRAGEVAPAIGIDIGRPGRRRHADHQLVMDGEPLLFGWREGASVQLRRGRHHHQATAGQPAQQDETVKHC